MNWPIESAEEFVARIQRKPYFVQVAEVNARCIETAKEMRERCEQECFNPQWDSPTTRAVATRIRAMSCEPEQWTDDGTGRAK